mmetsp:Transcript_27354/g.63805  ORF Transcript_27354/g.63805 Transcript_27354/m.63805 type:complete len:1018 (+) Transcript_27354:150-3203(+)
MLLRSLLRTTSSLLAALLLLHCAVGFEHAAARPEGADCLTTLECQDDSTSLHLLQRVAVSQPRLGKFEFTALNMSRDDALDNDTLDDGQAADNEESLLQAGPSYAKATIGFYKDASCSEAVGSEEEVSAENDFCAMDWNFTCGCDGDEKVLVAEHYYPDCQNRQETRVARLTVGKCLQGWRAASSSNLYMLATDHRSCPCCGATCTIYGDPHIRVFDASSTSAVSLLQMPLASAGEDEFRFGDYWVVKSDLISVQGRYRKVNYPHARYANRTFLTGLAVGGPFLNGHTMLISPQHGQVQWLSPGGDTKQILDKPGDAFKIDNLVEAHYREHSRMVKDPAQFAMGIYLHLPGGVRMEVNRFKLHLDMSITMKPEAGGAGGMDGQCGNFNGNPDDDHPQLISERIGYEIPTDENLLQQQGESSPLTQLLQSAAELEAAKRSLLGLDSSPAKPGRRTATLYMYADEYCQNPLNGSHMSLSVNDNNCELGWNFTCSCYNGSKVVRAARHFPSCNNPTSVDELSVPAGNCYGPFNDTGLVLPSYWRIDASSCPDCDCEEGESCMVHGDPHITCFDQSQVSFLGVASVHDGKPGTAGGKQLRAPSHPAHTNMYGWGDFWLVKSEQVHIQARYRKVYYPNAQEPLNHTFLTGVAVGGPFMRGHTLTIEPREGAVTWRFAGGRTRRILDTIPSTFELLDIVKARQSRRDALVPQSDKLVQGADFELPRGVKVSIDRFAQHMDVRVTMTKTAGGEGGVDGQCGNYNGDASDDTAQLIDERIGYQVPPDELLFRDDEDDDQDNGAASYQAGNTSNDTDALWKDEEELLKAAAAGNITGGTANNESDMAMRDEDMEDHSENQTNATSEGESLEEQVRQLVAETEKMDLGRDTSTGNISDGFNNTAKNGGNSSNSSDQTLPDEGSESQDSHDVPEEARNMSALGLNGAQESAASNATAEDADEEAEKFEFVKEPAEQEASSNEEAINHLFEELQGEPEPPSREEQQAQNLEEQTQRLLSELSALSGSKV